MVKWDCTNNTACISLNAKQLIDKQRIGRTMGRTRVFLSLIQEINYQHSSSFCYLKNRFHLLSLMLQADEIHVELLSDHWNTLRINSSESCSLHVGLRGAVDPELVMEVELSSWYGRRLRVEACRGTEACRSTEDVFTGLHDPPSCWETDKR